jgi:hypothetical protein
VTRSEPQDLRSDLHHAQDPDLTFIIASISALSFNTSFVVMLPTQAGTLLLPLNVIAFQAASVGITTCAQAQAQAWARQGKRDGRGTSDGCMRTRLNPGACMEQRACLVARAGLRFYAQPHTGAVRPPCVNRVSLTVAQVLAVLICSFMILLMMRACKAMQQGTPRAVSGPVGQGRGRLCPHCSDVPCCTVLPITEPRNAQGSSAGGSLPSCQAFLHTHCERLGL